MGVVKLNACHVRERESESESESERESESHLVTPPPSFFLAMPGLEKYKIALH